MSRVRTATRTVAFVGYTAATLGAYELTTLRRPDGDHKALRRWTRRYAGDVLRVFGIEARFRPGLPDTPDGPTLVVSNHRCAVDIGVLLSAFGGHVLSRADVAGWPLLGRAARRAGTLFVDRKSNHSGAVAIRGIRRLLRGGETVIVFPEGGTFRGDEVRPFRPGAFSAASGFPVQVHPVGLAYPPGFEYVDMTFMTHLSQVAGRRRTPVVACFGEPFAATGSRETAERARAEVQRLVHLARGYLT